MRILQVCSARTIGGGERHVADLSNQLSARGHEVFVALAPDSPLVALLEDVPKENIVQLPMRNALSLASAWKLGRFARGHDVQIIHAHLGRDYPLAALAAGRARTELVLTRHVMFPLGRIHRLTARRTARVIAVSRAVAEALNSQAIFGRRIIQVVYNGIDVERFSAARASTHSPGDVLRVGTVGELAPVKRHEDLIQAAQNICAAHRDVQFIIEGQDKSPEGQNRARLEKLIADAQLAERVRLTGWSEDIAELLATFDVFVSTSESESFGMAIAEAMAAGIPVVATATPGAREIIEADVTGRLVLIGDIDAITNAIAELLASPLERARLGANAHRTVTQRFGLDRMIDETVKIYEDVLG